MARRDFVKLSYRGLLLPVAQVVFLRRHYRESLATQRVLEMLAMLLNYSKVPSEEPSKEEGTR
tara:strand:- start:936 stop:1124 length:189 start_codon:yes stop_codon:yes gene_type:complete